MLSRVFVYGTLKKGMSSSDKFFGNLRISCQKGVVNGRLYAVSPRFPGLKLDDSGPVVYGELHTYPEEVMALVLPIFDKIEGYVEGGKDNLYNRKIVSVTLENGKEVDAYVYEYNGDVDESLLIESGEWHPQAAAQHTRNS